MLNPGGVGAESSRSLSVFSILSTLIQHEQRFQHTAAASAADTAKPALPLLKIAKSWHPRCMKFVIPWLIGLLLSVSRIRWQPFPDEGENPFLDLIAAHDPILYHVIEGW